MQEMFQKEQISASLVQNKMSIYLSQNTFESASVWVNKMFASAVKCTTSMLPYTHREKMVFRCVLQSFHSFYDTLRDEKRQKADKITVLIL